MCAKDWPKPWLQLWQLQPRSLRSLRWLPSTDTPLRVKSHAQKTVDFLLLLRWATNPGDCEQLRRVRLKLGLVRIARSICLHAFSIHAIKPSITDQSVPAHQKALSCVGNRTFPPVTVNCDGLRCKCGLLSFCSRHSCSREDANMLLQRSAARQTLRMKESSAGALAWHLSARIAHMVPRCHGSWSCHLN